MYGPFFGGNMRKLRPLFKRFFTPVTIMLIPHSRKDSINIKMPSIVLGMLLVFVCVGIVYTASLTVNAVEYYVMKQKYSHIYSQFQSMQSSFQALKESETEFKRLFSLGTKIKVLEAVDKSKSDGDIDIEELKRQISESMTKVAEIKSYLAKEKDILRSTPRGWPIKGKITSVFGPRIHPQTGRHHFHSGLDIAAPNGTPIVATASGIVSFAGWSNGNGNTVVIEHGHGFSTVYAHNSKVSVKAGQVIKSGETIAAVGATDNATGPHLHYEVWKHGNQRNPSDFLGGA